jgi:hypothetical protein
MEQSSVSSQLLLDVLPPWIHIHAISRHAVIFRWIVEQLVNEQKSRWPGAQLASDQLAQLLFIQILRAHLETAAPIWKPPRTCQQAGY